jgi:hypothetical protein
MTPNEEMPRRIITFDHEEVEALLALLDVNDLTEKEKSAKEKLKQIYARQILSYERRKQYLSKENL